MSIEKIQIITKENISVQQLFEAPLKFTSMNGETGWNNLIVDGNIHRPQLALAGFTELFTSQRVQMLGNTEMYYLKSLDLEARMTAFINIADRNVPCLILTNNHELQPELLNIANEHNISVLQTPFETTKAIHMVSEYLDDQFAQQGVIHGSFVDVYGVGVLFVGRSGIGKSEIALDLVERGHRLVADDVVMLTKKRDTVLMGTGTSLVKHFMEIRGLGIIDVRQMFGIRAIRFQKRLEILVELEDWDPTKEYDRTGLDESPRSVMGVEVSAVKLPIFPGKNITVISEVIALNYLLRTYGYNAPKEFANKLREEIERRAKNTSSAVDQRIVSYFQSDQE
ncbi:MAG: HPr kinase/phosphorylase [Candidatus Kapabacteria bacterium]|nr:HPr kinase/phosphorylase [Candidatus Kapabacteria bacterium]MBX7156680.1 HPr(Ser) kinase/phosphatase [Bacteroidota bacterium]